MPYIEPSSSSEDSDSVECSISSNSNKSADKSINDSDSSINFDSDYDDDIEPDCDDDNLFEIKLEYHRNYNIPLQFMMKRVVVDDEITIITDGFNCNRTYKNVGGFTRSYLFHLIFKQYEDVIKTDTPNADNSVILDMVSNIILESITYNKETNCVHVYTNN